MEKKECFLIASYCDTIEKENHLRGTINSLKRFSRDICVYAAYPLQSDIQNLVKYYIYDSENPIVNRQIHIFRNILHRKLEYLHDDYGYAVLHQLKSGCKFLEKY